MDEQLLSRARGRVARELVRNFSRMSTSILEGLDASLAALERAGMACALRDHGGPDPMVLGAYYNTAVLIRERVLELLLRLFMALWVTLRALEGLTWECLFQGSGKPATIPG